MTSSSIFFTQRRTFLLAASALPLASACTAGFATPPGAGAAAGGAPAGPAAAQASAAGAPPSTPGAAPS